MKRKLLYVMLILVAITACIEIYARFVLGLGCPAISIRDDDIDYLFAPNQRCLRFGNSIVYNNVSMRTDFDVSSGERNCRRRVLVCGDSVVNGGALTDQADVATSIVQARHNTNDVQILNISAGSWGPGNIAAYLKKFGLFDATDIIIEVNSHDLWEDDASIGKGFCVGHDVAFPDRKPVLALQEGVVRYLMPRIKARLNVGQVNSKFDVARWGSESDLAAQEYNLSMMEVLYTLPIHNKALLLHRTREETKSGIMTYGEAKFREQAETRGIPVYLLELDADKDYRDSIHLNKYGQRKMAALIEHIIGAYESNL